MTRVLDAQEATGRHASAGAPHQAGSDVGLMSLHASAGNAAVAAAIQRLQSEPTRPTPLSPRSDPRFAALTKQIGSRAGVARAHPKPQAEAAKGQGAAVAPVGDKEAQAKEAQSAAMDAAKPGGFDKAGFIAAVKAAIAAQAPKNLEEADEFGTSGKAENVKTQVAGRVGEGRAAAAGGIADATTKPPDESRATEKTVTPLRPDPTPALPPVSAAGGMPQRAPAEQTDFSGGKRETDGAMAEADVTEQQLANSNEPDFTGAVAAKKEGEQHSATAPVQVRTVEQQKLQSAEKGAQSDGASGLAGLLGAKSGALSKAAAGKTATKTKDETARLAVTSEIKRLFDATKTEVTGILTALDGAVNEKFTAGEKEARTAFTTEHKTEMDKYKDARYSGISGAAAWVADKVTSLPAEANQIFVRAKAHYEERMSALISTVADFIGGELTKAKERIARGRAEITTFVDRQPKDLAKVGKDAAVEFEGQFDQLESEVDSKKDGLVEDLAAKYVEAKGAVDEEITAAQEENKGLWDKAKDAIGGAIKTIMQLKDMLLGVLARAAASVSKIIKDPIGFLGNFVNAVKGGIVQFGANIVTHLKTGLQGWLFGALSSAGIELPEKFDLQGVLKLVLSILGLTWANVRARIVAKTPPGAIEMIEKGFGIVTLIMKEGLGGIWKYVLEQVGNIKEMVMTQVKEMVSIEIIKAGIVWLISLLNPASAFVKACKMIYDVVMFFVEKANQIKEFVDSILDSVESIAAGGVGAVAGYIENTLAKMLPVIIGFLASLLGLGGISGKIKKILETIQKPINKVIDWVVGKAVTYGKKAIALGKKLWGKAKAKGKELWGKAKKKLGIKEKTPEEIEKDKQDRLDKGVSAGLKAVNKLAGKPLISNLIVPLLAVIRLRYRMTSLTLVSQGTLWGVHGAVNPEKDGTSKVPVEEPKNGPVGIKVAEPSTPPGYIGPSHQLGAGNPSYTGPSHQLGPGNPTTHTLEQILKMQGKEKSEASENYIGQVYGGQTQVHNPVTPAPTSNFAVEGEGGRFTDAVAAGGVGQTLGLEVKMYMRWRTVKGVAVEGAVPLSNEIIEQVNKDVHLRNKNPGFDPRWIFLEAPPSPQLAGYLQNAGIVSIVHAKPVAGAKV